MDDLDKNLILTNITARVSLSIASYLFAKIADSEDEIKEVFDIIHNGIIEAEIKELSQKKYENIIGHLQIEESVSIMEDLINEVKEQTYRVYESLH